MDELGPVNVNTDILPVNHQCPDNCRQQYFISFEGEGDAMKEERKMRADDDGEALSEVPVPGMRAIEVSHTVEDVKLQEVELNHGPLKTQTATLLYLTQQQLVHFQIHIG